MSLALRLQPETLALAQHAAPQVAYVLLTLAIRGTPPTARAVNWALVADASRSMRIPIISDAQFRRLVRSGGAQEVLVDGVPVWQFSTPLPPELDTSAPNALDYIANALQSVVEYLHHADYVALVACAERATVVVPATPGSQRSQVIQQMERLRRLDLGDETDLAAGLRLGLHELLRVQQPDDGRVGRLVLLTDGFTQDAEACMQLARQAAAAGVAISTLGLGGDFQESLLTALADVNGGRAVFLHEAADIPQVVAQELAATRAVTAHSVALTVAPTPGVQLRHVTRIWPTLTVLEPQPVAGTSRQRSPVQTIHLGDMAAESPLHLLLELLVPAAPPVDPGDSRRVRLAQLQAASTSVRHTPLVDLVATYRPDPAAVPPAVLEAAACASAARMLTRALAAAETNDPDTAARLLNAVATRLDALGQAALAQTARSEAAMLQSTGQTTRLGAKELAYHTRRLGKR